MRSVVSSNRMRCLYQVAFIALTVGVVAGCSSDFARFDQDAYSTVAVQNNGYASSADVAANPYPAEIDSTTTASVGSVGSVGSTRPAYATSGPAPVPASSLEGRQPRLQAMNSKPAYQTGRHHAQMQVDQTTTATVPANRRVARAPLQPAVKPASAALPPNVDPIVTSSVAAAAREPVQGRADERGWTGTGGTSIVVREGETLYNISKRYGVPVREIMRVNRITNADHVGVGQRIVIPTYVYSATAPVSAPDSDPHTRAARASTGMIGESRTADVAIPVPNPGSPIRAAAAPAAAPIAASGAAYKVVSGDTLSAIAARHNVRLIDLIKANSLANSNIRVGQELVIPVDGAIETAAAGPLPAGVDPVVTGSTTKSDQVAPKQPSGSKVATLSQQAPSATGIGRFRWPVTGRVISSFGEMRGSQPNEGIDISVPEGTAVKAAENGLVIYSGDELEGFGNLVLIRHEDGWVSAYAHNKQLEVARGDKVRRGQTIARSGRTGGARLPMVHFELRKDSKPVDPQQYLTR